MSIKHLKFFNKTGDDITPELNSDDIYELNIHMNEVSTNLFETEHIFIFEEVFTEIDESRRNSYDLNPPKIISKSESLLYSFIEIMMGIDGKGSGVATSQQLQPLIDSNNKYNTVDEFIDSHNGYFNRDFFGGEYVYSCNQNAKTFFKTYRQELEEDSLIQAGYEKTLNRPRHTHNPETEDAFFIFKWQDEKYDNDLYTFIIDTTDVKTYYSDRFNSCFNYKGTYLGFVPLKNQDLLIDDDLNPLWKKIYLPYKFDVDSTITNPIGEDGYFNAKTPTWLYYKYNGIGPNTTDKFKREDIDSRRILQRKNIDQTPIQINFALNSGTEQFFERVLELHLIDSKYNPTTQLNEVTQTLIAKIHFFAEIIGEDERLRFLLENFGRNINETDAYVFNESDINEDLVDWMVVNNKRKELLLTGDEIYPYIGSYKGLINAIKYFGYSDIKLKQYILNIEKSNISWGQVFYSSVDIPFDLIFKDKFSPGEDLNVKLYGLDYLNTKKWKITARYNLTYPLNHDTGEVDNLGFPIIEEDSLYTYEEAAIKFYGLKQVLEKYFLPHHARIIDISAEGIYFAKLSLTNWVNQHYQTNIDFKNSNIFNAYPSESLLKNLNDLIKEYKQDETTKIDKYTIDDWKTQKLADIVEYNLYEYVQDFDKKFPFDSQLPLTDIKKLIPDYKTLISSITKQIKESKAYIQQRAYKNMFNKLIGTPIKLKLEPNDIKIGNLRTRIGDLNDYQYLNYQDNGTNKIGPYRNKDENQLDTNKRTLADGVTINNIYSNNYVKDIEYPFLTNYGRLLEDGESEILIERNIEFESKIDALVSNANLETDRDKSYYPSNVLIDNYLTLNNIEMYGGFEITWIIEHEDLKSYYYKVSGLVKDLKEILIFLPTTGYYNVTTIIKDITNFPIITTKKKCINIKQKDADFYAITRFIHSDFDYKNSKINNLNTLNPLISRIGDLNLTFRSLDYTTYQRQDFITKDIKTENILDIDLLKNDVIIKGLDFYKFFNDNMDKFYKQNVIFYKPVSDVPRTEYANILDGSGKRLVLDGKHIIAKNEKIQIYEYHKLMMGQLVVNSDTIIIQNIDPLNKPETDLFNKIVIGNVITFISPDGKLSYEILDVIEDFINNKITITVNNDEKSLKFYSVNNTKSNLNPDPYNSSVLPYNKYRWDYAEIKVNFNVLTATSKDLVPYTHDEYLDGLETKIKTLISLDGNVGYLRNEIIENYRCDLEINSGIYPVEIEGVFPLRVLDPITNLPTLEYNSRISVKTSSKNTLELISNKFLMYYSDYDIYHALQYGTTKKYQIDNMGDWNINDLKHLPLNYFDYHGTSRASFKITQVSNNGGFYINGRWINLSTSGTGIDLWNKCVDILNNSTDKDIAKFEFSLVKRDDIQPYIKAISKVSSVSAQCKIEWVQNGGFQGDTNTYPKGNFRYYEESEFLGINNPPLWNHLAKLYYSNKNLNGEFIFEHLSDSDEYLNIKDYSWALNGSFNLLDTFITNKPFEIPRYTAVFFVFDDKDVIDEDIKIQYPDYTFVQNETNFVWEIWQSEKLLIRSYYNYIIWNFVDRGNYHIKLLVKDSNNEYNIEKNNFIRVF